MLIRCVNEFSDFDNEEGKDRKGNWANILKSLKIKSDVILYIYDFWITLLEEIQQLISSIFYEMNLFVNFIQLVKLLRKQVYLLYSHSDLTLNHYLTQIMALP